MQLITRVIILAFCVFSACALPQLANRYNEEVESEENFFRVFMAQMRAALIDTRGLSPSSTACANYYNNKTQKTVERLTNSTAICEDRANRTSQVNLASQNSTVNSIRQQQLQIIRNIDACKNITDNDIFLNCTQAYFDGNLQLLDSSNSVSYIVNSEAAANSTVVEIERDNCISRVVNSAKVESIEAANEYSHCIQFARNQRGLTGPENFYLN